MRGIGWSVLPGVLLSVAQAAATTLHVDDDAAGAPTQDGSVRHPFGVIQDAIDAADDGDTVLVADGTYTGDGNRDLDFGGRLITVRSVNGPAVTVVDAEGADDDNHRCFVFENGEGPTAVVQGLTLRGGYVSSSPLRGGGVYCVEASPTFIDCVIDSNEVRISLGLTCEGGGVYAQGGAPTFIGCSITNNIALAVEPVGYVGDEIGSARGGGLRLTGGGTLVDCVIDGNLSRGGSLAQGGGLRAGVAVSLTRCRLTNNQAWASTTMQNGYGGTAEGGAAVLAGVVDLVDCTITGNGEVSAWGDTGGLVLGGPGPVTMTGCVIGSNTTGNSPAQVSLNTANATVRGCSFVNAFTSCVDAAGGEFVNCVFTGSGTSLDFRFVTASVVNCTFTGATAIDATGGTVTVRNCIIWDVTSSVFAGTPSVSRSVVPGGYPGVGNTDQDPLLTADLRLSPGSPAIDAGDNGDVPAGVTTDFDVHPRFVDDPDTPDTGVGFPPVDIGAFEYQLPCPDTNGDGAIDVDDLVAVIVAWGTADAAADVTADGIVDVRDLNAVMAGWGDC